jgi:hypothetical protein
MESRVVCALRNKSCITYAVSSDGGVTLTTPRDTLGGNDFRRPCTIKKEREDYENLENC